MPMSFSVERMCLQGISPLPCGRACSVKMVLSTLPPPVCVPVGMGLTLLLSQSLSSLSAELSS